MVQNGDQRFNSIIYLIIHVNGTYMCILLHTRGHCVFRGVITYFQSVLYIHTLGSTITATTQCGSKLSLKSYHLVCRMHTYIPNTDGLS